MKFLIVKSLQQRLVFFLLLPVTGFLFAVGFIGFIFARNIMLDSWREASILKLQRAAHQIDMRLNRPIDWIEMFHKSGGTRYEYADPEWILARLREQEGIIKVNLQWLEKVPEIKTMHGRRFSTGGMGMRRFHRANISQVTAPRYDAKTEEQTVSLISNLQDETEQTIGKLEVTIRFDYLMQDILALGWWQSEAAYLMDDSGFYLARTEATIKERKKLGEKNDPLELTLLKKIKKERSGTILGSGHPPTQVAGFHRLKNVPWTVVLFAPGKKILAPIVRFRLYYFLTGSICILLIIFLIRSVVGKMARSVGEISDAAEKVASGDYGEPLTITSGDEIGQLTGNFNEMVEGLKEKDFISNTFGRYVDPEIAKELMKKPDAIKLGGEKREVVILMSDLRNFTPLSELLSPEETIHILNHYFSHMIEIIQSHKGIIVDFYGDALLVFFNPLDRPTIESIRKAILCSFEMQNDIDKFNSENKESGLPELQMGIGINAGEVVVGNIGSSMRAKYGIVGAAVNLTHRIQAVATAGEVVISESVYRYLREELVVKKSLNVKLKGIKEKNNLYIVDLQESTQSGNFVI